MRKVLLCLFLYFLIFFPKNVFSIEYLPMIPADETLSNGIGSGAILRIDIINIENIDSFDVYVEYNQEIVKPTGCSTLNFAYQNCVTSDKGISLHYQYSDDYEDLIKDYGVFYVRLGTTEKAKKDTKTEVYMTFANAKDKNGKNITIPSATKIYTIKEPMIISAPSNNSSNNSSSNSNKKTNSNITQTVSKSENKALKSLEIEGVDFEFDRQKTDYTISVNQGVNKLNIKATPEDKNATYKVIGADNLTASKNIVRIEVTAEDKTKQTYYIRVRYDKEDSNQVKDKVSNVEKDDSDEKVSSNKKEKVNGNIIKWLGMGAGVFVGIGLITFIISKIKDRSIDKKLSSLDDD